MEAVMVVVVSIARGHDTSHPFNATGAAAGPISPESAGAEVDVEEYTAAWLAEHALASPQGSTAFHRDELT
jgi:hypothetical protein